ncbi:MAG: hypothetical protein E7335_09295 [Clostridiales bacterium]|nr:hypothetical protein [Clostridiales bacterium]
MHNGRAIILTQTRDGVHMNASCGRISTTQGSAIEIFETNKGIEADERLIKKVAQSGHMAALEHHSLSVAFDGASVFVEQFIIEHRLASYTVKSRRYVDFSGAGYIIPEDAPDGYREHMESFFADYEALLALDIPKEDARFVLPYAFRGQFYMTANVRTFIHLAAEMTRGRGKAWPEIVHLGNMLKEQLDAQYPGLVDRERVDAAIPARPAAFHSPSEVKGKAVLLDTPFNPEEILKRACACSGRDMGIRELVKDARPRELEMLNYSFSFDNISIASLTHLTRHRILSLIVKDAAHAVAGGKYIVPESVRKSSEALAIYRASFERACGYAAQHPEIAHYCALAGNTVDALVSMNAREILHFMKLRTCVRAQWEIRTLANELLEQLRTHAPAIFSVFGATCRVNGRCPEGRLSCGNPYKPRIGLTANRNNDGEEYFPAAYVDSIERAGGEVVKIPFTTPVEALRALVNGLDGVLFSGGPDIAPWRFGQELHPKSVVHELRDNMELALFDLAFARKLPILGICRGHQVINVALGGTLCQDIPDRYDLSHAGGVLHEVKLEEGSRLAKLFGVDAVNVNSYHHQCVDVVAPYLRVAGMCGPVNEALEWDGDDRWIFGVEWHPERMSDDPFAARLFADFVRACK